MASPLRILVLYWHPSLKEMRAAVQHHLRTLDHCQTTHQLLYFNAVGGAPSWLRLLSFDAIILHNTFLCLRHSRLFNFWKRQLGWIADASCLKIAIPQDEYDYAEVLDSWLFDLGVSIVFSNFDASQQAVLYPKMHSQARFYQCLTGYINEKVARTFHRQLKPLKSREYDVVYRAKKLPYYFGSHGQLKYEISDVVANKADELGLRANLSTDDKDVVLGGKWFDFLASSRTVIGCESGSSVLDGHGEVRLKLDEILLEKPNIDFLSADALMPSGWDDHKFFAISPRHFEAIMTKTCQILIEGHYDGVLVPGRHYISLRRDFSNLEDVLSKTQNTDYLSQIVEQAYEEIYLSGDYSYSAFAELLEKAIYQHIFVSEERRENMDRKQRRRLSFALQRQFDLILFGCAKVSEFWRKCLYLLLTTLSKK